MYQNSSGWIYTELTQLNHKYKHLQLCLIKGVATLSDSSV